LGFGEWILDIYIMCGITGILSINPRYINQERLKIMTGVLAHRGPDGEGIWINPTGNIGLGHRRLSIIDLSANASQPMHYLERYTLIHNGEIYNYLELKADLEKKGYRFRSRSDSEVILAAYDLYRENCLAHFDGMFAFVIWDEKEQILFCARDRFGEKPFYYSFDEEQFCFASERKSLWAGGQEKKINNPLLLNYLVLGFTTTAADNTISFYQDIFSLPASHFIKIHLPSYSFSLTRYWDGDKETKIEIGEAEAADKLTELLTRSVKRRLRSDVPVGTSLSGGLDSSSLVCLLDQLQEGDKKPLTFSAVFPGFERDESVFISEVTRELGLSNYTVTATADDFVRDFEKLCYHQEEPFTSSSVYIQYRVFELARQHEVKVLLDGQGADETISGYSRYIPWFLQELLKTKPSRLRGELKAFRKQNPVFTWNWKNYIAAFFPLQVPRYLRNREIKKIKGQSDINKGFREAFFDRQSLYKPLVLKLNDMLYFNTFQFGLEELLRYADRNSMANGREIRLPFLDHELVGFINSLPANFKMRDGWTKWILRKSMESKLPATITWRKDKIGYEPPQKKWMESKSFQEYIWEAKSRLVREKILDSSVLRKKNQPLDAYAADNFDWRYLVASAFI
jgi:asparagine synthase (glutamine-hydrolysing)